MKKLYWRAFWTWFAVVTVFWSYYIVLFVAIALYYHKFNGLFVFIGLCFAVVLVLAFFLARSIVSKSADSIDEKIHAWELAALASFGRKLLWYMSPPGAVVAVVTGLIQIYWRKWRIRN